MLYLLDTNVVSELRKAGDGRANKGLTDWLAGEDATRFFLSVVTLMELDIGVGRVERRDPAQGARLREWIDGRVLPEFADRILPIDLPVALRCAKLHVPGPRAERDALIAATALVHGMTVVTQNVEDFRETGVPLVNPWQRRT